MAACHTIIESVRVPDILFVISQKSIACGQTIVSEEAEDFVAVNEFYKNSNLVEIYESRMYQENACECPPDCNSVSFDASLTKFPLVISNVTVDYF